MLSLAREGFEMKLGELFFELGFKDFGSDVYKKFQDSVNGVAKSTAGMAQGFSKGFKALTPMKQSIGQFTIGLRNTALAATGVTTAMLYMGKRAADAAMDLDRMSTLTGLSTGTLQGYGAALAQTGGSVNDLAAAVQHLQSQSIDIALGKGGDLGVYAFLGLDPHEDPLKLLDKLALKLKTMPTALGVKMARDLGLSDQMIYFLKNKEQLFTVKKGTGVSDAEIRKLKGFHFLFTSVWEQAKRTMQKFAVAIMPLLTPILRSFERITYVANIGMSKFGKFFESMGKYMPWLVALGGALMAAFAPMTMVFTGLYLILDDIAAYLRGEDSIFGRIMKWADGVGEKIKNLTAYFWRLMQVVTFGGHGKYAMYFAQKIKEAELGRSLTPDEMKNLKEESSDLIKDSPMGGQMDSKFYEAIQKGWKFINTPVNKLGAGVTNQQNINIKIDGADSPKKVAEAVVDTVKDAFYQFGSREAYS